jgi:outer membrane protein OmpA-like peptidoglycan-associated protein
VDYSGLLTAQEKEMLFVPPSYYEGTFEHTVDASLAAIAFEPMIAYNVAGGLSLLGGLQIGLVTTADYEQVETIVDPADRGVFVDTQQRTRNYSQGAIPEAASLAASLVGGVRYEVPMNDAGTLFAAPEALYSLGLTEVVSNLDWKVNTLRLGVALMYRPKAGRAAVAPPPPLPPPPPPPPPAPPELFAAVKASGVTEAGRELPIATIRVEEFISSEMRPLLNYVFFAEGASVLPDRYALLTPEETGQFTLRRLENLDNLETYYHVLNIVGSRMLEHPTATLRLVGTNSDEGLEQGAEQLSRTRADVVKKYFVSVWGIEESRLRIEARNLPEKPSNIGEIDGIVENRRVELYSNVPEILDPIIIDDTLRSVNPPLIRFRPDVTSDAGVVDWALRVRQGGEDLRGFNGKLDPPETIDWNVQDDRENIPRTDEDLQYILTVTDAAQQVASSEIGRLPVEQITVQKKRSSQMGDKIIDRYNLILFDFNSELLGPRNERIVEIIRPRIADNATVTITGFTDRIGEMSVNQPLSEGRARSAAKALGLSSSRASGRGETDMYTNELPEGRFYCRTVTILVETPVE